MCVEKRNRFNVNAPVTLKIGEILQNSIRINEMNPSKETASESYALIGASATEDGQLYVVRSVVNRFSNEISSVDVLYAVNSKSDANKKGTGRETIPKVHGMTAASLPALQSVYLNF